MYDTSSTSVSRAMCVLLWPGRPITTYYTTLGLPPFGNVSATSTDAHASPPPPTPSSSPPLWPPPRPRASQEADRTVLACRRSPDTATDGGGGDGSNDVGVPQESGHSCQRRRQRQRQRTGEDRDGDGSFW
jgi:hypothetical protein